MIPRLARFNPEVFAPYLNQVRLNPDGLIHRQLAVRHIILPAVPGTGNGNTVKLALAERAPPVQAGIIYCVEFVSYIGNCHGQAIDLKLADGACRNLIFSCRTHKSHVPTPSADDAISKIYSSFL